MVVGEITRQRRATPVWATQCKERRKPAGNQCDGPDGDLGPADLAHIGSFGSDRTKSASRGAVEHISHKTSPIERLMRTRIGALRFQSHDATQPAPEGQAETAIKRSAP